jgi:hypothetical protein
MQLAQAQSLGSTAAASWDSTWAATCHTRPTCKATWAAQA